MQSPSHQPLKICPQCQTPAELTAPFCGSCGRQFRTQFAPPLQQTQVFTPPPHTYAPTPHGYGVNPTLLAELETQYKRLVHQVYACLFLLGFTVVGVVISLVLWMRFQDIRQRVATMGVDPNAWEYPLKQWARRIGWTYAGVFVGLLVFFCGLIIVSESAEEQRQQEIKREQQSTQVEYNMR